MKTNNCKKQKYGSKKAAERSKRFLNKSKGQLLHSYYCEKCDAYHLANNIKRSQRLISLIEGLK